jgi:hypothetical protein
MSSVINNSNANSAIVQTIEASESLRNPNVYSTKEIFPPHSMTYSKCESSNGSVASGGSLNFNLNKYGIASQILLHIEKTQLNAAGQPEAAPSLVLNTGDIFNIIKSVELLSSSRVISTLTSADLMAQFSNMDQAEFNVVQSTAINVGSTLGSRFVFVVPLCFGLFQDINLQPNLSFVEPMSIRVNWGIVNASQSAAPAQGFTVALDQSKTYLQVRYKAFPEDKVAQILDENYSQPELNQLATRLYNENQVTFTGNGAATDYVVDLKNTDAVKDFYIIVRPVYTNANGVAGNTRYAPIKINNVTFTGSGQEILNLSEHETPYLKLNAYGNAEAVNLVVADFALGRIVKIQTGVYHRDAMTNCFSLREINAPRITVNVTCTGAHTIDVVEDCLAIYSTSSATGRVNLSLSN